MVELEYLLKASVSLLAPKKNTTRNIQRSIKFLMMLKGNKKVSRWFLVTSKSLIDVSAPPVAKNIPSELNLAHLTTL